MAACFLSLMACGYSQQEWDQKLREGQQLSAQLREQQQASEQCKGEQESASKQLVELRSSLQKRGVRPDHLAEDLDQQLLANSEYQARLQQLANLEIQVTSLKAALAELRPQGVGLFQRRNQLGISIPSTLLFQGSGDQLTASGATLLRQLAHAIRSTPRLSQRAFQVAGHTDANAVASARPRDPWGASALQARTVLTFLTRPLAENGGGLLATGWSAAGFAGSDSVVEPATGSGLSQLSAPNSRVELLLLPRPEERLNLSSLPL